MVVPPPDAPEEDETPEEDDIPDDVPDDVEVPPDGDPVDEGEVPIDRCGIAAVTWANLAPMTAAAAAESRPTRQVIFLTRRSPSSLARIAAEYSLRFTASGFPVILWDRAEVLLTRVRIARSRRWWCGPGQGYRNAVADRRIWFRNH